MFRLLFSLVTVHYIVRCSPQAILTSQLRVTECSDVWEHDLFVAVQHLTVYTVQRHDETTSDSQQPQTNEASRPLILSVSVAKPLAMQKLLKLSNGSGHQDPRQPG